MKRTKEQADETAARILLAAESLFIKKGYEKAGLEEIAKLAGVTRGAVYWHFNNKEGLLERIRNQARQPFRKLANDLSLASGATSLERLGECISNMFLDLQNDNRKQGVIRITLCADQFLPDHPETDVRSLYDEILSIVGCVFQSTNCTSALSALGTPKSNAAIISVTIIGLITGWAFGRTGIQLVPEGAEFIRTILCGWIEEECYAASVT